MNSSSASSFVFSFLLDADNGCVSSSLQNDLHGTRIYMQPYKYMQLKGNDIIIGDSISRVYTVPRFGLCIFHLEGYMKVLLNLVGCCSDIDTFLRELDKALEHWSDSKPFS